LTNASGEALAAADGPPATPGPGDGRQPAAPGSSSARSEPVPESPAEVKLPQTFMPGCDDATAAEWADGAEVCLTAVLQTVLEDLRKDGRWRERDAAGFAVIALGRFGGRELQFGSDLDLFFLFEPRDLDPQEYERLARALLEALQFSGPDGPLFAVDLRLRPEGKSGFVASSEAACRRYYSERAQPWEFQTFLRARPVAGA